MGNSSSSGASGYGRAWEAQQELERQRRYDEMARRANEYAAQQREASARVAAYMAAGQTYITIGGPNAHVDISSPSTSAPPSSSKLSEDLIARRQEHRESTPQQQQERASRERVQEVVSKPSESTVTPEAMLQRMSQPKQESPQEAGRARVESVVSQPSQNREPAASILQRLSQLNNTPSLGRHAAIQRALFPTQPMGGRMSTGEANRAVYNALRALHGHSTETPVTRAAFTELRAAASVMAQNRPLTMPDEPSSFSVTPQQLEETFSPEMIRNSYFAENPYFGFTNVRRCRVDTAAEPPLRAHTSGRRNQTAINAEALKRYPETSFSFQGVLDGFKRWWMGAQPATSGGEKTVSGLKTGCGIVGAGVSILGLGSVALPAWLIYAGIGSCVVTTSLNLQERNYLGAIASGAAMLPSGRVIINSEWVKGGEFSLKTMRAFPYMWGRVFGGSITIASEVGSIRDSGRVDLGHATNMVDAGITLIQR